MIVSIEKNHKINDNFMRKRESIKEIGAFCYKVSTITNDVKDLTGIRQRIAIEKSTFKEVK